MGGRDPASFIAPGFRFHPTDEELVKFYLKRKLCGKSFGIDAIADADVYKFEPWDLPDKSALRSRDRELYFFSGLDKKYGHGSKTNRATEKGYWKTTGKDRSIYNNSVLVGFKKTLVFHIGRAPKGVRTDWVMHEYKLADAELKKAGVVQPSFVLCRIFQKSGQGPKNGEQHGAQFIEEEWEDEEEEVVITVGQALDDAKANDGAYLGTDDLEQLIDFNVYNENKPLQMNYYHGGPSNQNADAGEISEEGQKPLIGSPESFTDLKLLVPERQRVDEQKPNEVEGKLQNMKSFVKEDEDASEDNKYLLDEPYVDENLGDVLNEGLYLETDDFFNPIEEDPASLDMLHEYLAEFNASDEMFLVPNNYLVAKETQLPQELHTVQKASEDHKLVTSSQQLANARGSIAVSSSNQNFTKFGSDSRNPVVKHAITNRMLESIPAPPAFAAEFPTKDVALSLASATESQNSGNFTSGMMHAGNTITSSNGVSWSFDKNGKVQLIFSLSVAEVGLMDSAAILDGCLSSKTRTEAPSRMWMYLILFWVSLMFFFMKIGTYVYAK